tara:strand:- start:7032 stop:7946 length:915 start_codon:yes stop_codon:yes gene_type:complete
MKRLKSSEYEVEEKPIKKTVCINNKILFIFFNLIIYKTIMSIISTKDLDIYFERSSPKENGPILYIGGTGGDLRNKPNQLDSPLTEYFEVISYDQRGLGQTSKPSGAYTMQQYADDAANLLNELELENIPIIGVSFGGMVAQELVKRHPSKASKLVLACTSAGGQGGSSYPLHELEEFEEEDRLEKYIKINDRRISDEWIRNNQDSFNSLKQNTQKRTPYKPDSYNLLKQLLARKAHNTFEDLKKIDIPVFLMGGKYDGIAPKSNMESMHQEIKKSKLRFYEGGHLFMIQDKKAFKELVEWLLL